MSVGFSCDGFIIVPDVAGGGGILANFVDSEIPTDTGDHLHFTLAHVPNPAASLELFYNGLLLLEGAGNDYLLLGNAITMNYVIVPGSNFVCWYRR